MDPILVDLALTSYLPLCEQLGVALEQLGVARNKPLFGWGP